MHKEWVKHRSSQRFVRNLNTLGESGVQQALSTELTAITAVAIFVVAINLLLGNYLDLAGISHPGPFSFLSSLAPVAIPGMAYTTAMPSLALLLVFRTNTAYSRWNEARTLWGGVVNNCRNVVRQSNIYFPSDRYHDELKEQLAANTAGFCKALKNFLRGPDDDEIFRGELMEMVDAGLITVKQVDAAMAAKNRPMFFANAMSESTRKANIDVIGKQAIDRSISVLVDLCGACERIFKSPVPLVYTRHTSRFLTLFLLFLPFGLWKVDESWNHWATIPMTDLIAFFLLGIEEIGIQLEEPFSVLPLEALCNGAIAATLEELLEQSRVGAFELNPTY
jgi:predicted membrane chloride channel (bestrophin family)